MKPISYTKLAFTAVMLTLAPAAFAASDSWTGATDGTWATSGNWLGGGVVPGTGETATFDTTSANTTIDLGAGVTIGTTLFNSSPAAYTIGSGAVGSQTLSLDNAGAITLNGGIANNQLFNAKISLSSAAAATANINNDSSSLLTVAGGIAANVASGNGLLTVNGAGNTTVTGAITKPGAGSLALLKTGAGQLTISSNSVWSGAGAIGYVPATSVGFPLVAREGTLLLNGGGTNTVTGELVIGGVVANGGVGQDAKIIVDGSILNVSTFLSVGRGNGVGGVSSDLVLTNSAIVAPAQLSAGFNGAAGNLPKGSITLYNNSSLRVNGASFFIGESAGSDMTLTLNGSSGVTNLNAGGISVGRSGIGRLLLNSGTTLSSEGDVVVQYSAAAPNFGSAVVNGGTLKVATATKRWLQVGRSLSGSGQLIVSNGLVALNTSTDLRFSTVNTSAGTNEVSLRGGNITFYSDNSTTVGGAGQVDLMQTAAASAVNTFNLDGGTLTVSNIVSAQNSGTRFFNFNGGTLKPTANTPAFLNLGSGNAFANVRNGGAVIDANGKNITIAQPLLHSAIAGDAATDGGLTKNNTGTLTVSGANTYTGPTTVTAGALVVDGTMKSQSISLSDSVTLGMSAFPATQWAPTTMAVGSVSGGAVLNLKGGSTSLAPLAPGTLTFTGSGNTINVVGGTFVAGNTYPLIACTNAIVGSYTAGTLPAGVTGTITTVGNSIVLNVTTVDANVWSGLVNGTWDINTTANWTNSALGNKYLDGSTVQFDDTGINTTTVSNSVATVLTPSSVLVTNNTKNYAFKANTIIAGPAGLTKTGTGNLTNSTPNTYTGPTVINKGALVAGVATVPNASGALGLNSAVTLANDTAAVLNLNGFATQIGSLSGGGPAAGNVILGAGTLTVGADNTSSAYAGNIAGTGGLTKIGTGTLTIGGTNTYTGATTVSQGTVTYASGAVQSAAGTFTVGSAAAFGTATMNVNSGSTVSFGNVACRVGDATGVGILNLNGGTFNGANDLRIGSADANNPGLNGTGTLNMTGGTANLGALTVSRGGGSLTSVSGSATVSGGTMTSTNDVILGSDGSGLGQLTISGSAIFNVAPLATKWVQLGALNTSRGQLDVNGGTINLMNNTSFKFSNGNTSTASTNVINQNGGTIVFYSDGGTNVGGTGDIDLARSGSANANNTYNLNGGTLTVPRVLSLTTLPTRTFNFNGGTLKPAISTATFFDLGTGNATANVRDNGAIIDTTNFNITMVQPLVHSTIGGDNATDGGLTKLGTGTLTLAGAATYTGPTKVFGGTLSLNTFYSGANVVVSNATLTLNASSSTPLSVIDASVTVGSTLNLTIYPYGNDNNAAIKAAGNVTLGTNTTLNLAYGAVNPNPTTPAINLTGTLTKGTNIVINISAGGLSIGSFPLITAGSAVTTNDFKLGTLPPGIVAVLTNSTANSLDLLITGAGQLLSWHGANADNSIIMTNWNINADTNWYDLSSTLTKYLQYSGNSYGDNVTFGDSGYNVDGTNNVNLPATVVPATVTFSSGSPYRLTGAGGISGVAPLLLTNGAATFYLETSNSYTGGTVIGSGALAITNDNALGNAAGPVSLVGGALQLNNNVASSRSLSVNASSSIGVIAGATAPWSGVLSGTGTLTKTDNGTLTFSTDNTFAGSTVVSAGTLNYSGIVTNTLVTVGNVASVNASLGISGNVRANSLLIGNNSGVAASVIQTGGNSLITGGGGDCMSVGNIAGAYGYYNAVAGTLTVNGIAVGGENNTGAGFSGTGGDGIMEINGATVNNVGWIVMARGATAETGILNVFSGSLAFAGGGLQPNWGAGQTSIINIMGGSVTSTNVPVNFRNANNIGILNLNGGLLQATAVTGAGVLNFNGGTLSPATSFATPFLNLSSNVYVYNGGATINDNGQTLTINQPLLTPTGYGMSSIALGGGGSGYIAPPIVTISGGNGGNATAIATVSGGVVTGIIVTSPGNGYLAGDEAAMTVNFSGGGGTGASATVNAVTPNTSGGLVKKGAGTLTLSGASTYTGLTMVTNGTLLLTPAHQAGGTVVVADSAKFGVVASSVSNSATIGALTLGSSGATTLVFTYGLAGNPTNVALTAGAVALNGTSSIQIGGSFALGAFPVLKYTSLSGAFNSTVTAPRGMGASVSNDTVNKVIYVVVTSLASPIVWAGTSSIAGKTNLWDLNTTTNWLIAGSPTTYQETLPPGDAVVFNDTGTSLVLLSNTASPASMIISNTAVNYTFQGSGQINSLAGLTKVGSGSVTLNLPGTYALSTVVSNGTLSLGTNQTFANLSGNGTVATAAGAPTVTVNNTTNTTFSGSLQGGLGLTKTGNGTLTLSGTSAYTWSTFVRAGTVVIDNGVINNDTATRWTSIGQNETDNATFSLIGTGVFTNNNDFNIGDVGSAAGTVNISNSATLLVNSLYVASANAVGSTASGTVNQAGGAVQNTFTAIGGRVAGSTNGVGIYNMSGGTLTIPAAGSINVGRYGTGTMNLSGTASVSVGTGISYVGYRLGDGTLNVLGGSFNASGDLRVGGSDVNGPTNDATGVVVVSNATMSVGSLTVARGNFLDNTVAGSVTVKNGGTLICTNDATLEFAGTGLGKLAIDGGTFIIGTAAGKWLMVGGYDTGWGELDITNGNLFLENGSSIKMCRNGNTGANVVNQVGGNVTFFSDAGVTVGSGGALDLDYAGGASSASTYNLDGGTLTVPQIIKTAANGTGTINLNGGTLKAAASSTTFMQGLTAANVLAGGALIDTTNNNITIAQVLLDGGAGGGLTKTGNGTLTLNGVNTYTGPTAVNAGLLGGTGTIAGTVTVGSGAGLAPGNGTIGTLTVNGNITLNGLSTNVFEVNGTTPANDAVAAGASVTYGGVLKIAPTGSFTIGQQFQLFSGTGATNASNFASVQSTAPGTVFGFTNGVLSVTSVGPTGSSQLTNSVTGGGTTLSLSWGAGWKLQMQTNSLSTGLSTNWTYITDGTLTSTNITIEATKPTVFYRLVYP